MGKGKRSDDESPIAEERPLPPGWAWATIDDIAAVQGGIQKGKSRKPDEVLREVLYLRVANVQRGYLDLSEMKMILATEREIELLRLQPGDILFNEGGDRDKLGRGWVWSGEITDCIHQNHVFRARLHTGEILPRVVSWYANSEGQRYFFDEGKQTTNLASINLTKLRGFPIPIPPSQEQTRIAEAIEMHFSKLDAAVEGLKRVQANLKRYRASVLQAAVEGRLVPTEAALARQQGRDYEPAPVLLERILTERRRRWERAELARMKAKGKTPRDDAWKARYKEPATPDTSNLPTLPDGWCWATIDQLAEVQGGIQKGKKRKPNDKLREVPYLRVANVQRGYLDLSEVKTISVTEAELDLLRLQVGDVLFNEGGDRDKLGRGWVWNGEISDCIHQNHVFRARLLTNTLLPQFLSWYGNSSGQQYFFEQGKQTTNLASLNLTKLRGLPVPIPPVSEQKRIATEVEKQLSDIDAVQISTEANIIRCHRLRQSILKWAFEGKLVDQDPGDEPASALLERIRAERVACSTTNREAAALGGVGTPPRPQAEGRGRTGGTPPRQSAPAVPRGQRKPRKQKSTAP